jgi:hypothetical protein
MGGMMDMCRGIEPSFDVFLRRFMELSKNAFFRRRGFQAHRVWFPLCGEKMVWVLTHLPPLRQELSLGWDVDI